MKKVFVLRAHENWIVDRFAEEWFRHNADITTQNPLEANVVWLLASWCWRQLPFDFLNERTVITTVHHIVPEKFDNKRRQDFMLRDMVTDIYHVYNSRTYEQIRPLTKKPIVIIQYWANQNIWKKTVDKRQIRQQLGIDKNDFVIGSFQRDTEGSDLKTPKLEKGPDLFVDAIVKFAKNRNVLVLLGGWRREYIINRLNNTNIRYVYNELPSQVLVNEMYQAIDLYAVTARHEGGPQALIECGLVGTPCVSRPVGIAEQVLPSTAINTDVTAAIPAVPDIDSFKLPIGFDKYRELICKL